MDVPEYNPHQHLEDTKRDLLNKFARNDFHGVADCAMDAREIIAFIKGQAGDRHP